MAWPAPLRCGAVGQPSSSEEGRLLASLALCSGRHDFTTNSSPYWRKVGQSRKVQIMKAKLNEASGEAQAGERLVDYVKRVLDGSSDDIPAANVPRIFRLAMELDPLALIHGFQISLKGELTF